MGAGQELQGKDISMGSNMHTLLTDPEGTCSCRAGTSHCLLHSQMLRGLAKAPCGGCTLGGFPPGTELGLRLKWGQAAGHMRTSFLLPCPSPSTLAADSLVTFGSQPHPIQGPTPYNRHVSKG